MTTLRYLRLWGTLYHLVLFAGFAVLCILWRF